MSGTYPNIVGKCKNKVIRKNRAVVCGGDVKEVLGSSNSPRGTVGGHPTVTGFQCDSCKKEYSSEGDFKSFAMEAFRKIRKRARPLKLRDPKEIEALVRKARAKK